MMHARSGNLTQSRYKLRQSGALSHMTKHCQSKRRTLGTESTRAAGTGIGGAPQSGSGGVCMRVGRGLGLATLLLVGASGAALAQGSIPDGDWRTIDRDAAATRFSPLDEINKSNVAQLRETWSYPFRAFNTAV